MLQQRPDVLIVGEAADGLEAVHKAAALQPDVVTIDIGLPTLNGIQVAGRIRALNPHARLLFVTNEASTRVVDEAFNGGAHGFVHKPRVNRDLLSAIDAILGGRPFVSGGLKRPARLDGPGSYRHDVLFYSSDAVFVAAFNRYIVGALSEGSAVIVLASEEHAESLHRSLGASNVDLGRAIEQGRYIPLNISEVLAKVTVNGWPDPMRFLSAAGDAINEAAARAVDHSRIAACGECAPTLWAQGHLEAAIQVERLWDEFIVRKEHVDTLCAYPMAAHQQEPWAVRSLCAEHTAVEIQ
jgi:CheY-like chemotaxis protein